MNLPAFALPTNLVDTLERLAPPEAAVDARYLIRTEVDADILCRLLNQFALQGQVAAEVSALRQEDYLRVMLRLDTLPRHRAEVIAQRMRSMVAVCSVDLYIDEQRTVRSAT